MKSIVLCETSYTSHKELTAEAAVVTKDKKAQDGREEVDDKNNNNINGDSVGLEDEDGELTVIEMAGEKCIEGDEDEEGDSGVRGRKGPRRQGRGRKSEGKEPPGRMGPCPRRRSEGRNLQTPSTDHCYGRSRRSDGEGEEKAIAPVVTLDGCERGGSDEKNNAADIQDDDISEIIITDESERTGRKRSKEGEAFAEENKENWRRMGKVDDDCAIDEDWEKRKKKKANEEEAEEGDGRTEKEGNAEGGGDVDDDPQAQKRKRAEEDAAKGLMKKRKVGDQPRDTGRRCSRVTPSERSAAEKQMPGVCIEEVVSKKDGSNESNGTTTNRRRSRNKSCEDRGSNTGEVPEVPLPFVESLRGTIKNLSRSDLEELIVQKLCEVITERSVVGELRRKAQILQEDQERWRDKVASLTKQLREMDMVMKKYLSEVQRQNKDKTTQYVAPLRVTRSVGLQVSFSSSTSRQLKHAHSVVVVPTVTLPTTTTTTTTTTATTVTTAAASTTTTTTSTTTPTEGTANVSPLTLCKGVKQPLQRIVSAAPNAQLNLAVVPVAQAKFPVPVPVPVSVSVPVPVPVQVPVQVQAKKLVGEAPKKAPFAPHPGINVTIQARLIQPQAVVAADALHPVAGIRAKQPMQLQLPAPTPTTTAATASTPPTAPTTTPPADENSLKVIDLTEDDDRQNSENSQNTPVQPSISVRSPGQLRVVNHIQPVQVTPSNGVAYLVPASTTNSTPTGRGVRTQTRPLLLTAASGAQQPRPFLPSVPPLLYKGSTVLQPGGQPPAIVAAQPRAQLVKPLRHPAPLPQQPQNQITKPNWKLLPPKPDLKISKVQTGIVLSWDMDLGPEYEQISSYQLYAYQESNMPPATSLWKKVGDVKALKLPMACTLTQFMSGYKYHFAVRAVDLHSRIGPFSCPGTVVLVK